MGRNDLNYATATFVAGINQDVQNADFRTQCADARNVWTPFGGVERRPGSELVIDAGILLGGTGESSTSASVLVKSVSGVLTNSVAGVLDLSYMGIDDIIYMGWTSLGTDPASHLSGISFLLSFTNANATRFKLEYFNGTEWRYLPALRRGNSSNDLWTDTLILQANAEAFMFVQPGDWATGIGITALYGSRYWLRLVLKEVAIDASTATSGFPRFMLRTHADDVTDDTETPVFTSLWSGKIGNNNIIGTFWQNYYDTVSPSGAYGYMAGIRGYGDNVIGTVNFAGRGVLPKNFAIKEPLVSTSVAYEDAIYVALASGVVTVTKSNFINSSNYTIATAPTCAPAAVEDDPLIVGTGAPYDLNLVAQTGNFPNCRYLAFFQNRFWCAGIEGAGQIVRWGAAAPYHRVFPALNYEDVIENSSQDISGLAPLGADMIVYKPDSIHKMIYTGLNAFEEATFVPQTVSKGIGCVSNASIADVNGHHVFLSNRGLVRFDGTKAVYIAQGKVNGQYSDRLQEIWSDLTPGRYAFSVGMHWKAKHCYLIAVSYKGSETNNLVICWDYVQNAFWLWDELDVAGWVFEDEHQQVLCYSDSNGRIFRLAGEQDYGTNITAYVTTPRLGYNSAYSTNLRLAEVTGLSTNSSMTTTFIANDQTQHTGTLAWLDPIEDVYGTGKYGTAKYWDEHPRSRRLSTWQVGRNHQVKLASSSGKFSVDSLRLGFKSVGKR